jgi:hypothetical protein
MLKEFILADLLLKFNVSKDKIIAIISILNIVLYILLIGFFYSRFKSTLAIAAVVLLLVFFYFLRLSYLKKYLQGR